MDAKEARRRTQKAIDRKRQEQETERAKERQAIKDAEARGRRDYAKYLKKISAEIKEAVHAGKRSLETSVQDTYSQSHPVTNAYYAGVQHMIKRALELDGFKVTVGQRTDVDHPFGSDPMFTETMYWLRATVKINW